MTRVCFDSRPASASRGIGRYTRSLLTSLRAEAARRGGEIVEGRQPRRADDVFHAPWVNGALLRPRVPQVVTVHDLVHLKRPGQALRAGLRGGMRGLAVERASRLIVPTRAVADDAATLLRFDPGRIRVIGEAPASAFTPRPAEEEGFGLPAVEALACGTPVVACDGPALREVLGDRVTFVDCDDIGALMETGAAAKRPAPGPPEWTWDDAAAATWSVYEEAVAE